MLITVLTAPLRLCVYYYTLLYCIVLYCTALHCTALHCTVLYCTVLYCTVLYCTVLYCTVLYCIVCIVSYRIVAYCTSVTCPPGEMASRGETRPLRVTLPRRRSGKSRDAIAHRARKPRQAPKAKWFVVQYTRMSTG